MKIIDTDAHLVVAMGLLIRALRCDNQNEKRDMILEALEVISHLGSE